MLAGRCQGWSGAVRDPHQVLGALGATSGDVDQVPDRLRRRLARVGPDGEAIEVLAARRGLMMRHDAGGSGAGGGDSILGAIAYFVLELLVTLLLNTFLEAAATERPWKVKAYRLGGPFPRRSHPERLPEGVEPEERMVELLDEDAPSTTP